MPEDGFKLTDTREGEAASSLSFERVEVFRAMDIVLQGADEVMQVVSGSSMSGTLCVMVKPQAWWATLEQHFPAETAKIYEKFKDIEPG